MNAIIRQLLVVFAFVAVGGHCVAHAAERIVWIASVRGTINPASSDFFLTSIKEAQADGAEALIVELDTPGGLLSSVREMAQAIDEARIPVVVYVAPAGASATSAGALLMLASHIAAMAPGTNIGAAHPVGPQGEEIKGPMGEKAVSDTAAFARSMAGLRGRNTELAEAVVSKSKSFTAEEAAKSRLIEIVAPTREALLREIDGRTVRLKHGEEKIEINGAIVKTAKMTLGQSILNYLANPNIAAILMTLAMLLIYMELSNPGITVAGIAGGICLLVALMAFQLLPIRTGGAVLIVFGIILMAAEPFVTSHGALAAGGITSFILGLLWLMDPSATDLTVKAGVWIPAAVGLGTLAIVTGAAAARARRLTRQALSKIGGSAAMGLAGYVGRVESAASDGKTGKAIFRGELWDVKTEDFIKPADFVEALSIEGFTAKVRIARRT